jgi:internalin A
MRKSIKGLVLVLLVAILLMGTALGAGFKQTIEVWFNSINLTVNGQRVEVKNILYEGTTYVPIRAVSEILRKDVSWDNETRTANITGELNDNGAYSKTDIDRLRLYIKISSHSMNLQYLADSAINIGRQLDILHDGIVNDNDSSKLHLVTEAINDSVGFHNNLKIKTDALVLEAEALGVDVSDMYFSLGKISEAFPYYEKALKSLEKYSLNKTKKELEDYVKHYEKAEYTVYQQENFGALNSIVYDDKIAKY